MILSVLDHNRHQLLNNYNKDEYMISDKVEPYPIELWNWGLANRSGHLRKRDIETVRLNLLPEAEAWVNQNGISFANLTYSCELASREEWFERAGERGSWKIKVAHDPRTRSRIYIRLDNGKRMETCHLLPAHKTFLDRDWYETLDEFELRKQRQEESKTSEQRSKAEFHAATNQIIDTAKAKTAEARIYTSDRARVSGIRQNRRRERELERHEKAWELGSDPKPTDPNPDQTRSEGYVPPPQPTAKLRSIRERRMKK
jgi:hypothetical protein